MPEGAGARCNATCHRQWVPVRGQRGEDRSDAAPSSEPRPGAAGPGERAACAKAGDLQGPRLVRPA